MSPVTKTRIWSADPCPESALHAGQARHSRAKNKRPGTGSRLAKPAVGSADPAVPRGCLSERVSRLPGRMGSWAGRYVGGRLPLTPDVQNGARRRTEVVPVAGPIQHRSRNGLEGPNPAATAGARQRYRGIDTRGVCPRLIHAGCRRARHSIQNRTTIDVCSHSTYMVKQTKIQSKLKTH